MAALVTAVTLAASAVTLSCRDSVSLPEAVTPPSLLLITVDTLRPDALGWIGGANHTPAVDALAATGFAFPHAVSPVPLTLPAHVSLMTGRIPPAHGVRDNGQTLGAAPGTLAEILSARGYRTAAFVSGFPLKAMFGLDRGFEHYDDTMTSGVEGWVERIAPQTTLAAAAWIAEQSGPWFVWVHYYDPHDPYVPPRTFWKPGPRGAYDGEVEFTDSAIGELLASLPDDVRQQLVTVFAADHGEALGEHGESSHGYFVYDSTVTVPLIFHQPGRIPQGRSKSGASLVDVVPTVLEILGIEPAGEFDGVSLVPTLVGTAQALPPVWIESEMPWRYFGWAPLRGVRDSEWKLIVAPRSELYDLRDDPGETRNLFDRKLEVRARLLEQLESLAVTSGPDADVRMDDEALEKLRSLGYVGVGATALPDTRELADPKDRLPQRELLLEGERAMGRGEFDAAVGLFEQVLADDPDNRAALLRGGTALLKKGDLGAARPYLVRAVEMDAERPDARFALGDALTRLGENELAAEQWSALTRLQPRRVEAWSNLGTVLRLEGLNGPAADAFERAHRIAPGNDELRRIFAETRLASALDEARAGRPDAARRELAAALGSDPSLSARVAAEPLLADLSE